MCHSRLDKIRFHEASNKCAARDGSSALCSAPDKSPGAIGASSLPTSCTRCGRTSQASQTHRAPDIPRWLQNWLVSGVTSMCHSRFDRFRFHRTSIICAATDGSRAICRRLCCDASTRTAGWTCRELARSTCRALDWRQDFTDAPFLYAASCRRALRSTAHASREKGQTGRTHRAPHLGPRQFRR